MIFFIIKCGIWPKNVYNYCILVVGCCILVVGSCFLIHKLFAARSPFDGIFGLFSHW